METNTSWHEQMGLVGVSYRNGWFNEMHPDQPIGEGLTLDLWQQQLRLSAVKGGLYGSGIPEMAVLMLSASSETENLERNTLGHTRILKVISESLSRSGMSDMEKLAMLVERLAYALGWVDVCLMVGDKGSVIISAVSSF